MVHILRKIGIIITCCLSISIAIVNYVYMSVSVQREYVTSHVKIGTNYKSLFTDKNSVQLPSANRLLSCFVRGKSTLFSYNSKDVEYIEKF